MFPIFTVIDSEYLAEFHGVSTGVSQDKKTALEVGFKWLYVSLIALYNNNSARYFETTLDAILNLQVVIKTILVG